MDALLNLYHSFVDFILALIYLIYKLGVFIKDTFYIVLVPFQFIKDIITGLDFSKTYTFTYNGGEVLTTITQNLGLPLTLILGLFFIIILWQKVKDIF